MESNKILVKHHKVKNMKVKEIIVDSQTVKEILNAFILNEKTQKEIVNQLVDEDLQWLTKSKEEQTKLIYSRLKSETIVLYLHSNNYMPNCDSYSVTENEDGDFYINSFTYTNNVEESKLEGAIKNGR